MIFLNTASVTFSKWLTSNNIHAYVAIQGKDYKKEGNYSKKIKKIKKNYQT
jgi:hypothetical protein